MPRQIPTESDIPLHGWLPYSDVHRERIRAHAKHDAQGHSVERATWEDSRWLPILTEELGEVARCLCDDSSRSHLREELIQLAAMATAWIDAIGSDW